MDDLRTSIAIRDIIIKVRSVYNSNTVFDTMTYNALTRLLEASDKLIQAAMEKQVSKT